MRRLTLLGIVGAVAICSFALAQHPLHIAHHHAMMRHQAAMYLAAMMYHAAIAHHQAMAQQHQAALAQQAWRRQAAWHAKSRKPSNLVVRPSSSTSARKVARPVIVAATTSSPHQTKPAPSNETVTKSRISVEARPVASSSPGTVVTRFRDTEQISSGSRKYVFKQSWTDKWSGPTGLSFKESLGETQQTSVSSGKEVIKTQWSEKIVSSPAFAYLPLQVQLAQLEQLLPYQPWYYGRYYPQKETIHSKISWPGGIQTVSANFVDRYDKAGRFAGIQVQVKDSVSVQAAPLPPQAQLNYLAAAGAPGNPSGILNPLPYSWPSPYAYWWIPYPVAYSPYAYRWMPYPVPYSPYASSWVPYPVPYSPYAYRWMPAPVVPGAL